MSVYLIPGDGAPFTLWSPIAMEPLLTIDEACELLAIRRTKLYALMERGELPYVKIGKCRRLKRADVQKLVEDHTTGGWNVIISSKV